MSFKPTPKQALILWNLIITREEPIKSKIKPVDRNPLKEAGLIDLDPSQARSQRIILTDKAWDWASETFDLPLRDRPTQQEKTLQALLTIVGDYLTTNDLSLADFISSAVNNDRPSVSSVAEHASIAVNSKEADSDVETRIRNACLQITGGEFNVRVRLSQLRQHLADLPRTIVDETLVVMQLAQKLALMPLDDPQEIKPEDEQAALDMSGSKRHIIYLEP